MPKANSLDGQQLEMLVGCPPHHAEREGAAILSFLFHQRLGHPMARREGIRVERSATRDTARPAFFRSLGAALLLSRAAWRRALRTTLGLPIPCKARTAWDLPRPATSGKSGSPAR